MAKKDLVLSILAVIYGLAVIVAAFIDKEAFALLLKLNLLGLLVGVSISPVSAIMGSKFGKKN